MYLYKEKGQGIIFSTVSGAIILLDSQEICCIERIIEQAFDYEDLPEGLYEILREQSFIVPVEYDERKLVIDTHQDNIDKCDTLHLTLFITDGICRRPYSLIGLCMCYCYRGIVGSGIRNHFYVLFPLAYSYYACCSCATYTFQSVR